MLNPVLQFLVWLVTRTPGQAIAGMLGLAGLGAATVVFLIRRRQGPAQAMRAAPAAILFLLFCLGDGLLIGGLPYLRVSFSPEIAASLFLPLFTRLLVFVGLLGAAELARWRARRTGGQVSTRPALALFLLANLALTVLQVDAYVVEAIRVETTEISLVMDELDPDAPPVRLVHLSDIHVERYGAREELVVRKVNDLQPDVIVLTGDYLNLSYLSDPVSAADFRRFVNQLDAPYGIYAVRGSVEPTPRDMAQLLAGTEVVWLENEAAPVDVRGQQVTLVGVSLPGSPYLAQAMAGVPDSAMTVLLFHKPDLIYEAAEAGVDLYLGGHTHGGQIRLPFYGAIITNSATGRRYAAGLFEVEGVVMYISRGIGFEGGGLPRARFLCRPEIVSIELRGR